MKTLIVALVALWLIVAVIGLLVEGLLWLLGIGLVLVAITAVYGWVKLRSHARSEGAQ